MSCNSSNVSSSIIFFEYKSSATSLYLLFNILPKNPLTLSDIKSTISLTLCFHDSTFDNWITFWMALLLKFVGLYLKICFALLVLFLSLPICNE